MKTSSGLLAVIAVASLAACATTGSGRTAASSAAPVAVSGPSVLDSIPLALRWYRASAEVQAMFLQTYHVATDAVERLAPQQSGQAWAVIMDADETVLDNSLYQQSRGGRGYSAETWEAWVKRKKATAIPGAVAFIARVRTLGGKVVIVTNREESVCAETRENLRAVGLNVDQVLCKPVGASDKNPRFSAVERGVAPSTLAPLKVVMWLGDNIQDFPGLSQDVRGGGAAGFAAFGRTWFVLPNPLYGSWDKNPVP